jgi:hypothetical protein
MLLNYIKLNTIVVFFWSVVFIWFFFFCKYNLQLSKVNVFNVDPYDAVGSAAIQISFVAAAFSMLHLSQSFLLFSVHFEGESIIIDLFCTLFRIFLGIINKEM